MMVVHSDDDRAMQALRRRLPVVAGAKHEDVSTDRPAVGVRIGGEELAAGAGELQLVEKRGNVPVRERRADGAVGEVIESRTLTVAR
jgi:hypothetical protein